MSARDVRVEGPLDVASLARIRRDDSPRAVVALGTFDGVHKGHQTILGAAIERRNSLERHIQTPVEAVAFTFDKLPLEVIRPDKAPPRLMTTEARCMRILEYGMDRVVMAAFNDQFAQIDPEAYVSDVLFGAFNIDTIVVGFNHTFGRHGRGNVDIMRRVAQGRGASVHVVGGVTDSTDLISSTFIRNLLTDGECEKATKLLGRPYFLEGTVIDGFKKGRLLGYPTANLKPASRLLVPKDGVYLTRVKQPERDLGYALTVVSDRPTFQGESVSIESHILDYSGDLYGADLRIHFLEYIRPITRFSGPEQLVQQIEMDVQSARERIAQRAQHDTTQSV